MKTRTQEISLNDSTDQPTNHAPDATVQDALAELPIVAAMLAVANIAAAVVLFQRAQHSFVKRFGAVEK